MTNWDYYEAVVRFQRIMDAMGVNAALKKAGAERGDLIMIDEYDFDYGGDSSNLLAMYLADDEMRSVRGDVY
jgi:GTPase